MILKVLKMANYKYYSDIERHKMFMNELTMINDPEVFNLVQRCLTKAPNYFFGMPASTSGNHHPRQSLGEGGLVRHSRMLCFWAKELIRLKRFETVDLDCALASCILHDCCKCGYDDEATKYEFRHPQLAASFVAEIGSSLGINKAKLALITTAIASHMGQWNWNFDKENPKYLPKPATKQELFVHFCDYLASRKGVEIELA